MTIVAILSGILQGGNQFFTTVAYERMGNRLRSIYFEKLLQQEIGYFDINQSGKLLSQLSEDIVVIQDSIVNKIANAGQFLTQGILGLVLALTSSWQMTLVMLACSPIIALAIILSGTFLKIFTQRTSKASADAMQTVTEVVGGIRTVRSMAGEKKEITRFSKNLTTLRLISFLKACADSFTAGFTNFAIWGSVSLAFWYGGTLVRSETITIGDMMKVFGMMLIASIGFSQCLTVFPEIGKASSASNTILKVIHRTPRIKNSGGKIPNEMVGNVDFKGVEFEYPSRPGIPVLKNFNLSMKQGQKVALVGPSGSGKSTTVGLIERFYEPVKGNIFIDGVDISEINPVWLHEQIGIVTQEPVLFAMTLKENIMYGVKNATQEQIEAAAKTANAHSFIMELKKGYDTKIGERGVSLSGGQKQRIAIARAVLQNPKLLLLDEATSALDTESEHVVQDALNKLMEGRTTIIIAHRLATIQDCDHIVVIEAGVIVEEGKHSDLISIENGVYSKLAKRQMMFAEKDKLSMETPKEQMTTISLE